MSGFATIARGGSGTGINGQSNNAAATTQFGETAVAQLSSGGQGILTHGINPVTFVTSSIGAAASVTSANNLAILESGTASTGSATLSLRRNIAYRAGQGSMGRMTAIFGTPAANNYQLVGLGNADCGYFFGYQGTNFGVLHITDGYREVRKLTVAAGVATSTNVTVTLSGEARTFSIAGGSSVNQTSWEISQQDYSNMAGGWQAEAYDGTIYFIALTAGSRNGSYSATGTGLTATFSQTQAGVSTTVNFTSQSQWNIDTMDGNGPSRFNLDKTKGNVYQVGFQYLGFGNARFAIEDTNTGLFQPVHMIKQANSRTTPVLRDPNLSAEWMTQNVGGTTSTQLKAASVAIFTEGIIDRSVGSSFSWSRYSTDLGSQDVERPFFTVRSDKIFNNTTAHAELVPSSLTITPIGGGTHSITVRVRKNPRLTGPVNFQNVDATSSFASADIAATGFTSGTGQLVATYTVYAAGYLSLNLKQDNFYIASGETLTITAEASSNNVDCAIALTWFEDV